MNIQFENINNDTYQIIIDQNFNPNLDQNEQKIALFNAFQQILESMIGSENYTFNTDSLNSAINQMVNTDSRTRTRRRHRSNTIDENEVYYNIEFQVYELDEEDDDEEKKRCFSCCKEINEKLGKSTKIKDDDVLLNESCFICIEPFKKNELKRLLPKCNHSYHKKCIDKWLKNAPTCPICRVDLLDDNLKDEVKDDDNDEVKDYNDNDNLKDDDNDNLKDDDNDEVKDYNNNDNLKDDDNDNLKDEV